MVRRMFFAFLLSASLGTLSAQVRVEPEGRVRALYGLSRVPRSAPLAATLLTADLGLSAASPDFRSEILARFLAAEPLQANLSRAWVRARLGDSARITAGLTRLSWGQGFFFNSGDILYGSTGLAADLTAETLREEASPLISLYHGLGDISFLEAVVLPPALRLGMTGLEAGEWRTSAAGGRLVVTLPEDATGLRIETGYLFRGGLANPAFLLPQGHVPFLALQGSFWGHATFYTAARMEFDPDNVLWESVRRSLNLSAGLHRLWSLEGGGSFSVRLEGVVEPGKNPIPMSGYAEVTASPDGRGSFLLRAVSHSDSSALFLAGWIQRMYQGLTAHFYLQAQAGEATDVFGWGRARDLGAVFGMEYRF